MAKQIEIDNKAIELENRRAEALDMFLKIENEYQDFAVEHDIPVISNLNRHPDFERYRRANDEVSFNSALLRLEAS